MSGDPGQSGSQSYPSLRASLATVNTSSQPVYTDRPLTTLFESSTPLPHSGLMGARPTDKPLKISPQQVAGMDNSWSISQSYRPQAPTASTSDNSSQPFNTNIATKHPIDGSPDHRPHKITKHPRNDSLKPTRPQLPGTKVNADSEISRRMPVSFPQVPKGCYYTPETPHWPHKSCLVLDQAYTSSLRIPANAWKDASRRGTPRGFFDYERRDRCGCKQPSGHVPIELRIEILKYLDVASLVSLYGVNSTTATQMSDSFPILEELPSAAYPTLSVLGKSGMLKYYKPLEFSDVLLRDRCVICNSFGSILYMPSLQRCCAKIACMDNPLFDIASLHTITRLFGFDKAEKRDLPVLNTLTRSSPHMPWMQAPRKRHLVVSVSVATRIYRARQPNGVLPTTSKRKGTEWQLARDMAFTTIPSYNPLTTRICRGIWCRGCEWSHNVYRYPSSRPTFFTYSEKAYSEEEFIQHMKVCKGLIMLARNVALGGLGGLPYDQARSN